ncbi:MAG: DUF2147 domain-containing protein [Rhodobiaceae bacterium]|nr:DUF2147 domain-containing protein [Rhodobiaceae bacterium]
MTHPMQWLGPILGMSLFCLTPAQANSPDHEKLIGTWATQGYGAQVLITPCGRAGEQLCGQITWLWTDRDSDGHLLRDEQNPVARHRDRPLVGIPIFRNFVSDENGRWQGDGIYNPEDGNTYAASLKPSSDGTLSVTGCVLGIFCQSQIWRRPHSVCPATIAQTHKE